MRPAPQTRPPQLNDDNAIYDDKPRPFNGSVVKLSSRDHRSWIESHNHFVPTWQFSSHMHIHLHVPKNNVNIIRMIKVLTSSMDFMN